MRLADILARRLPAGGGRQRLVPAGHARHPLRHRRRRHRQRRARQEPPPRPAPSAATCCPSSWRAATARVLTCSPHGERADVRARPSAGSGLTGVDPAGHAAAAARRRAWRWRRRTSGSARSTSSSRWRAESDAEWEYTAAWIDCLAAGASLGRGIFSRARHAAGRRRAAAGAEPRLARAARRRPGVAGQPACRVRAFNSAVLAQARPQPRARSAHRDYEPVLYPLDAIGRVEPALRPSGLLPVPVRRAARRRARRSRGAARGDRRVRRGIDARRCSRCSATCPRPASCRSRMPGATLALDFPNRGEGTRRLLARLEAIVVEAGGRLYPAKDSLMASADLPARLSRLERIPAHDRSRPFVGLRAPGRTPNGKPLVTRRRRSRRRIAASRSSARPRASPRPWPGARRSGRASSCSSAATRPRSKPSPRTSASAAPRRSRRFAADFARTDALRDAAAAAWEALGEGGLDLALIAYGSLPDQRAAEARPGPRRSGAAAELRQPGAALAACSRRASRRRRAGTIAVDHLGRGRPRAAEQLHLRRRQGRAAALPRRLAPPARRRRRAGARHPPGLRGDADDRAPSAERPALGDAGPGGAATSVRAVDGGATSSTRPGSGAA